MKNKIGKMKKLNNRANSHFEFLINRRILNSKRSQGHVEIILSFVIFIGFLLFLFIFMNPFAKTKETSYIMDNIQKSIINEISDEVGKLSVVVNENKCYDNSKFNQYSNLGNKIRVVQDNVNTRKYNVYYGDFFEENNPACSLEHDYTLGTYSIEKMIIYNKIESLVTKYNSNYEDLKKSLGITNNFLFEIKDLDGTKIDALSVEYLKNIPTGIDIEAREIPIRIIQSNGIIIEKKLYIRAW